LRTAEADGLLLVIDQLEELVGVNVLELGPNTAADGHDADGRAASVAELVRGAESEGSPPQIL
jgi:hypothetical protein